MKDKKYLDTSLPLEERVSDLISQMTLDEKLSQIQSRQKAIPRLGVEDYHICAEAAHGLLVRGLQDPWPNGLSTVFPQPIGLSSTWDTDLLFRIGNVISDEARVWYKKDNRKRWLTLWFPTIDMERDPRWGRNEEAYGEDPFLVGKLAAALIRGTQGEHPYYIKAACAPKHFYANNVEEGRGSASSDFGERLKHEYYLKVFKHAFIEGKTHSLMTAYNEINGVPCIVNHEVKNIVKGDWGCEGFIVCDGDDLTQTVTLHKWCDTNAEAIAAALKAGVDSFTDRSEQRVYDAALEAINKGYITENDIDKALTNIFKIRFRLGQFDPEEMCPYNTISQDRLCCKENSETSLEASKKSIVLLKNDGILPLSPQSGEKLLIIGDLAEKNMADWYSGLPPVSITPKEAIIGQVGLNAVKTTGYHDLCSIYDKNKKAWLRVDLDGNVIFDGNEQTRSVFEEVDWGFNCVSYKETLSGKYLNLQPDLSLGCFSGEVWGWFTQEIFLRDEITGKFMPHGELQFGRFNDDELKKIASLTSGLSREIISDRLVEVVNASKEADTVLLFLGNHPLVNGRECFDRPSIYFPARWTKLINAISSVNKNIVLSLISGYPYAFPGELDSLRAVLYTSHGEQYIGTAISDAIFGKYNPAGRLSMTWYQSEDDLPDMNDYDIINSPRTYMYFDKKVQFPFGHGLSYTTFDYSNLHIKSNDGDYLVSCDVKNIGSVDGDEVVQLYVSFEGVPVKAPIKKLCGFSRVNIKSNETTTVTFNVPSEEVRLYCESDRSFSIIPKQIKFMIASSSENIQLEKTI